MYRSQASCLFVFLFLRHLFSKCTVIVPFFNPTPVSNFWRHSSTAFFETLLSEWFYSDVFTSKSGSEAECRSYYRTDSFLACSAYLWYFLISILRFSFFCIAEGASFCSD